MQACIDAAPRPKTLTVDPLVACLMDGEAGFRTRTAQIEFELRLSLEKTTMFSN